MTEYYPPFGAGGAERTTALHAEILTRAGHSVTVITPNYGAPSREFANGVEVIRFPFHTLLSGPGKQVDTQSQSNPVYHLGLARQILKALKGRQVTCIHAQNSHSLVGAYLAARWRSLPLISHIRDTAGICSLGAICLLEPGVSHPPANCSIWQHTQCYLKRVLPLWSPRISALRRIYSYASMLFNYTDFRWRRRVYMRSNRIVFASNGLMKTYGHIRNFNVQGKHRVVYAPIVETLEEDEEDWEESLPLEVQEVKKKGGKIILYVGKVSPGKGAPVLFDSHRRLLVEMPMSYLVVAGNINRRIWKYDGEKTILLGFVDQKRVSALFCACDIVVVPSTWPEPLGWATIEAGRYGKPVVATRVGGIPEAVEHGVTGLLVDKLDTQGFKEAMQTLLSDEGLRQKMGQRAQEKVLQKFGEEAVRSQLEDLYRGL